MNHRSRRRHMLVHGQGPADTREHQAHRLEPQIPCRGPRYPVVVREGRTMFVQTLCRRTSNGAVLAATMASVPCRKSCCLWAVTTCPSQVKVVTTSDLHRYHFEQIFETPATPQGLLIDREQAIVQITIDGEQICEQQRTCIIGA